ncbi:MAG: hypothetical protein Kow0092_02430 [Deferrisomatales bacterium]
MTLFTKENCAKCDYVKRHVDLDRLGVRVEVLGPDNPDALAHLAWHGLVSVAEKSLPILVVDDGTHVTGAIPVKNYLKRIRA